MNNDYTFDTLWEELKENNETSKTIEEAEELARIIKTLSDKRIKMGLTQTDLAIKCGMKQPAIARMENLQVVPRLDTIIRVSKILNGLLEINFSDTAVVSPIEFKLDESYNLKEDYEIWNPSSIFA